MEIICQGSHCVYRCRRKVPRKLGRRVLSASHYIYKVGERSLVGRLGMFDRRKKRSEFFGRVFVLVLVKSIRVPFGGDLRDGLWGWSGGMRNVPC